MKALLFFGCILLSLESLSQLSLKDSLAKQDFFKEQQQINQSLNNYFNKNQYALYSNSEESFIQKIDSLRDTFIHPLDKLKKDNPGIGSLFFEEQYTDLNYTFNKFILDYTPVHKRITGNEPELSNATKTRLQKTNISDPALLKYDAFRQYLQSLLEQGLDRELNINRNKYRHSDNQRLEAGLAVIHSIFKNPVIQNRMKYELLYHHIDNYGVKNITANITAFNRSNKNNSLQQKLDSLYQEGLAGRKGHQIEAYKTIGKTSLDLHIFQSPGKKVNRPVIVFFHGGGWSEGMPDWFFASCEAYAKKGWVAVAVEYRLRNRHGSLPPAAIEDGKSAIRFLRKNAARLQLDSNRIIASGNSAGANLALALAMIDTLDNSLEDLHTSSKPNAVMLNSVSTDFTNGDFWQQYISDKAFLERISPLHQVRKNSTPVLIIQGNRDNNVPLQPVMDFAEKMKAAGNDCELHVLDGAGHFIWYDRRFSNQVNEFRNQFMARLGYDFDPIK